ncbi:lytic transglycosylase domain-containing protein [Photorhabdus heterorhabditis]|uniref:lytic transglycosylase domain-containing protein n=1 Tax=Photorhabdus heterorhabditis TaxID=880156 RepID=UPI001562A603|nr:lytic transglycosylase domain-containing protein [Photorhabdus heterorhabditis]NRN29023.1 lytic transglycosylase domain-containing protein [Photorhabdus heterorhabditis subsp. aluminescens]
MFTPPAEHERPIPIAVPVEIRNQCVSDAANFFGIDPELVFTLFDNEGGKVGSFVHNTNGSYDIGPMQINSSNLPEIREHFPKVTWKVLAYDACANFWVGTWWLYRKIVDRKGNVFEGIGDYNSKTPKVRAVYIFKFMERYNRRIQQRNGMHELYQWTQPWTSYNGHTQHGAYQTTDIHADYQL